MSIDSSHAFNCIVILNKHLSPLPWVFRSLAKVVNSWFTERKSQHTEPHPQKNGEGWMLNEQKQKVVCFRNALASAHAKCVEVETTSALVDWMTVGLMLCRNAIQRTFKKASIWAQCYMYVSSRLSACSTSMQWWNFTFEKYSSAPVLVLCLLIRYMPHKSTTIRHQSM